MSVVGLSHDIQNSLRVQLLEDLFRKIGRFTNRADVYGFRLCQLYCNAITFGEVGSSCTCVYDIVCTCYTVAGVHNPGTFDVCWIGAYVPLGKYQMRSSDSHALFRDLEQCVGQYWSEFQFNVGDRVDVAVIPPVEDAKLDEISLHECLAPWVDRFQMMVADRLDTNQVGVRGE